MTYFKEEKKSDLMYVYSSRRALCILSVYFGTLKLKFWRNSSEYKKTLKVKFRQMPQFVKIDCFSCYLQYQVWFDLILTCID